MGTPQKKPEREYVSVIEQHRSDNNKPYWVVTWTPKKGDRRRITFSDRKLAESEADRIERLMALALSELTNMPRERLVALNLYIQQFPEITPHEVYQFYFEHHGKGSRSNAQQMKVAEACAGFIKSRNDPKKYSQRQRQDVRQCLRRFSDWAGARELCEIKIEDLNHYIKNVVGGAPKTRWNHTAMLRAFGRWMRLKQEWFPFDKPSVFEKLELPFIPKTDKEIYTPEEMTRLLVFTPSIMLPFVAIGAFGGIRAAERMRLTGEHWQSDNLQFALDASITKTKRRRIVGGKVGLPNLPAWMALCQADGECRLVACKKPYALTGKLSRASGVPWKHNALRSSFASYHLQKYKNPQLTAMLDGHTVEELETSYKGIRGVSDRTADEYASITPQSVIQYADAKGLPMPEWARKAEQVASDVIC